MANMIVSLFAISKEIGTDTLGFVCRKDLNAAIYKQLFMKVSCFIQTQFDLLPSVVLIDVFSFLCNSLPRHFNMHIIQESLNKLQCTTYFLFCTIIHLTNLQQEYWDNKEIFSIYIAYFLAALLLLSAKDLKQTKRCWKNQRTRILKKIM